jgi:uncharacterized membrane protein
MNSKQSIFIALAVAFTIITYANIVSSMRLSPPWDTYLAVGGAILIMGGIYAIYEKNNQSR